MTKAKAKAATAPKAQAAKVSYAVASPFRDKYTKIDYKLNDDASVFDAQRLQELIGKGLVKEVIAV